MLFTVENPIDGEDNQCNHRAQRCPIHIRCGDRLVYRKAQESYNYDLPHYSHDVDDHAELSEIEITVGRKLSASRKDIQPDRQPVGEEETHRSGTKDSVEDCGWAKQQRADSS